MTWESFLSMVICSKNIKESQFIFSLIIFFLSKELKGESREQHFQGRVAREGREEDLSPCSKPAESIAVFPAGAEAAGRLQEHSWTLLCQEIPAEVITQGGPDQLQSRLGQESVW